MSRIESCFNALKAQGKKALIPYITAGDPEPQTTVSVMHAMVTAGADIIELGVPFSDPMADGPIIQAACERALAHGVTLKQVLSMVSEFRRQNESTPVVLMGYLNPIEAMGYGSFAQQAHEMGVDGAITVDLPPEEAQPFTDALLKQQVDPIFLLAPTSNEARIKKICAASRGFVYYVSMKGVTGSAAMDVNDVKTHLALIRRLTNLPVGVGFGIKDAQTAAQIATVADAVVVGSAIVKKFAEGRLAPGGIAQDVHTLLAHMRQAMDERSAT